MVLDPQTLRVNSVINNQDKLPLDVVYPVITDMTWPMSDALRTRSNGALAVQIHSGTNLVDGPLACMLMGLDTNGALIAAEGAVKTFGICGMDLKWDYFQTPGMRQISSIGPNGVAEGFPVHYGAGQRIIIDRYMIVSEAAAPLVYVQGDLLYRSTTGMITKDSATDTTVLGQVLFIYADGRLDCKFQF
jgi:hypothetical protein